MNCPNITSNLSVMECTPVNNVLLSVIFVAGIAVLFLFLYWLSLKIEGDKK